MEPRKETRKITFKSLIYSDCSLAILSKILQFGFKPEGNYKMQMQILPTSLKQATNTLPVDIGCNKLNESVLLSDKMKFIRFKTNFSLLLSSLPTIYIFFMCVEKRGQILNPTSSGEACKAAL